MASPCETEDSSPLHESSASRGSPSAEDGSATGLASSRPLTGARRGDLPSPPRRSILGWSFAAARGGCRGGKRNPREVGAPARRLLEGRAMRLAAIALPLSLCGLVLAAPARADKAGAA